MTVLPASEVWWTWKYLSSLKSLSLTIHNVLNTRNEECFVLTMSPTGLISSKSISKGFCFLNYPVFIKLPEVCGNNACQENIISCLTNENTITISWRCEISHAPNELIFPTLKKISLECGGCGTELSLHATNFKPLPSEYWGELIDCWSCHRQEFAGITKDLSDSLKLYPCNSFTILYSQYHFLIKLNDNFILTEGVAKCSSCFHTLGGIVHSDVVLVSILRTRASPGLQKFISHKILDAMQAHSSFSFCINQRLYLQLVNWTSLVSSRNSDALFPVIFLSKILANDSDGMLELIELTNEEFDELERVLVEQVMDGLIYLVV